MPAVTRKADMGTGHGCWVPRPNAEGSPDVYVNGIPLHRQGDAWLPHTCPSIPNTHAGNLASGSSTVYCNGMQVGRIGDPVDCGSFVAQGSPDVYAGG